ncbi:ATP-binding protein [Mesorhizobium sp. M0816]|uniref:ATP-binding protein n=1 Tax=Mesorhizobium sp. M0816 TaxID=2957006 RepID=UPI003338C5B6
MLAHPTLDRLNAMGLTGMAKAFNELAANAEAEQLSHARMADAVARPGMELPLRSQTRRPPALCQAAPSGRPWDVNYRGDRGLDRALFLKLIAGDWIDAHDNLAICGPSGVGKS